MEIESRGITLIERVKKVTGQPGSVYYRDGNFYGTCFVSSFDLGRVRKAVRKFLKENRAMVDADRAKPGYLTVAQLCDQGPI